MIEDIFDKPDDFDYFVNKRADRTYISKAFPSIDFYEPGEQREIRILSKVFDPGELHLFAWVKGETVLRVTPGQRQEIKLVFYEDSRQIKSITIQRFTRVDGKPHKTSFTFTGADIEKLYNMLRLIKYMELDSAEKVRLDDQVFNEWLIT
jgi:hypothetical protein